MDTGKVWFVMPAFREARVIASTLAQFRETGFNVVVVDDGSDDDTGEIAHRNGAWVCRHVVNLGAGAALQTGLEFALRNGADYLVTFDADGQHRLDDAVVMLSVLRSGGVDVVLGSRFLGTTEGMPPSRRRLLTLATWYTRLQAGLPLTDTHNGLRAFSAEAARQIELRHNRMAHASELLKQIAVKKLRWQESPCTVVYTEYSRAKGQRNSGMFDILLDLFMGRLHR
ncbi:MAG: glycosyltransferase family 2 protein [Devosia sp.]|nr:glycosyltransferase family 2 protein [Devosia sp.]